MISHCQRNKGQKSKVIRERKGKEGRDLMKERIFLLLLPYPLARIVTHVCVCAREGAQ
jgi:hypothetical protein